MKKLFSVLLIAILCLSMTAAALAQSVAANGIAVSTQTEIVSAAVGGTVQNVSVSVGDAVSKGDVLVALDTNKVYALQDGVARLFGAVGDDAAAVSEQYGAVAYIEPTLRYSISTSAKNAYALEENKIIHPGESVYLRAVESSRYTGVGRVTSVTDSNYTVEVLSGNLESGETVNIYRSAGYAAITRIGRDSVTLNPPIAYTADDLIAAFAVSDGAQVKKGDVLFETLEGAYSNKTADLTQIVAPANGIISSLALSKGSALSAGSTAAEIYLDDGMRIEASVAESDLQFFRVGNTVKIEFNYLEDGEFSVSGIVEKISRIGAENTSGDSEAAWFSVMIRPENTDGLFSGLHAVITAADAEITEDAVQQAAEEAAADEQPQRRPAGEQRP